MFLLFSKPQSKPQSAIHLKNVLQFLTILYWYTTSIDIFHYSNNILRAKRRICCLSVWQMWSFYFTNARIAKIRNGLAVPRFVLGANYMLPEAFNFDMLVLVVWPAEQKRTRQCRTHNLVTLAPTRGTAIRMEKPSSAKIAQQKHAKRKCKWQTVPPLVIFHVCIRSRNKLSVPSKKMYCYHNQLATQPKE